MAVSGTGPYDWFNVAFGSVAVEIVTALATLRDRSAVPDAPLVSVAFAVNENDPPCVGVPAIAPAVLSVTPAGSAPPARVHVYDCDPPDAPSVCVGYGIPTAPPSRDVVVTLMGDALTVMLNCDVDVTWFESVTVIEIVAVPVVVVVPVIVPALEIERPDGNPDPVNVYEPLPPAALTVAV